MHQVEYGLLCKIYPIFLNVKYVSYVIHMNNTQDILHVTYTRYKNKAR